MTSDHSRTALERRLTTLEQQRIADERARIAAKEVADVHFENLNQSREWERAALDRTVSLERFNLFFDDYIEWRRGVDARMSESRAERAILWGIIGIAVGIATRFVPGT